MDNNRKLVSIASQMVEGSIDILCAVRAICSLSSSMPCRDEYPIIMFRGIDSETDSFVCVTDKNRELYSTSFLTAQEIELAEYFDSINEELLKGAKDIIRLFSR